MTVSNVIIAGSEDQVICTVTTFPIDENGLDEMIQLQEVDDDAE